MLLKFETDRYFWSHEGREELLKTEVVGKSVPSQSEGTTSDPRELGFFLSVTLNDVINDPSHSIRESYPSNHF